jgi:hypothetical protein
MPGLGLLCLKISPKQVAYKGVALLLFAVQAVVGRLRAE